MTPTKFDVPPLLMTHQQNPTRTTVVSSELNHQSRAPSQRDRVFSSRLRSGVSVQERVFVDKDFRRYVKLDENIIPPNTQHSK